MNKAWKLQVTEYLGNYVMKKSEWRLAQQFIC